VEELTLKHTIAVLTCTAALVSSLTACGYIPSRTTTIRPTTTPPTANTTGAVALAAHSTYDYNGLTFVVNLPADIPAASQPYMRLFSEFLQADGRTMATNKVDPAIARLASAAVAAEYKYWIVGESVQGIGSVTYTFSLFSKVITNPPDYPIDFIGCLDQSKLRQVRKNGTHFDDNGNKDNTLNVVATIDRGTIGLTVTRFTFDDRPC
jgi:hypothetical protein